MRVLCLNAMLLCLLAPGLKAEIYPMEAGTLDRQNQPLQPSSFQSLPVLSWSTQASEALYLGQAIQGPIVTETSVIQTFANALVCFNRTTGVQEWQNFQLGPYWNEPFYDSTSGTLYALDESGTLAAIDPTTGTVLWIHSETQVGNNPCHGSVVLTGGQLIYGGPGNGLVSISAATHNVLWRCAIPSAQTLCSPAVDEAAGLLYVSGQGGWLACIHLSDGSIVWQTQSTNPFISSICLAPSSFFVMDTNGVAHCYRRSDGANLWNYATQSWSCSNLSICGDLVIASSDDRHVYALSQATGQVIWSRSFTGNFARCAPFLLCGTIYISGCAGQYYGLNGATGALIWSYNAQVQNSFVDWAEADGQLYVCNESGKLFCFHPQTPGNPANCVCNLKDATFTPTPTLSPTRTNSFTHTPTFSHTPTSSPTSTPSPTDTATPSISPTSTASPSESASPSSTETATPSVSPSATETATLSVTPSNTASDTATLSSTPTSTPRLSATATASATPSPSPGFSFSPSPTYAPKNVFLPTSTPDGINGCSVRILNVKISPCPQTNNSDRKVAINLLCGCDNITCTIYTRSCVAVAQWQDQETHSAASSWVDESFPAGLRLCNGTYYVKVSALHLGGSFDLHHKFYSSKLS